MLQLEAADTSTAVLCALRELGDRCCDIDVDRRPDMQQIVEQIEGLPAGGGKL